MFAKTFTQHDQRLICIVHFWLPEAVAERSVHIVGDFNSWDTQATPMHRDGQGFWRATLELETGRVFRFRYWVDNERWLYEEKPDARVFHRQGMANAVLITDPYFDRFVEDRGLAPLVRLAA